MFPNKNGHVTLGPPGTGKTTTLIRQFDQEIGKGIPPHKIAYVSFTRAARLEVTGRLIEKFGFTPDDCCWVRTIHSTAYRLLGIKPADVMNDSHWSEFAKANAFKFTHHHNPKAPEDIDNESALLPNRTKDDRIRFIYDWGRSLGMSPDQTMSAYRGGYFDTSKFRRYHQEIIRYKREKNLVDFSDMLEMALRSSDRPNVSVAFIDEAQDLSPLQQQLCEKWFSLCDSVFVAGDDDQCIFGFQGANPKWLLGLTKTFKTQILTQSYRVPINIHAEAQEVITRNKNRIIKNYLPTSENGSVDFLPVMDAVARIRDESTFVLGRNWYTLNKIARELFNRRIPYIIERWIPSVPNPYGFECSMDNVKTVLGIIKWHQTTAGDLLRVLDKIRSKHKNQRRFLPHGVKTRLQEMHEKKRLSLMALIEMGLDDFIDTISTCDDPLSVLTGMNQEFLSYCRDVIDDNGNIPEPKVRLMSIHRSKGREADKVIIIPDMSKKTYIDWALGGKNGGFEDGNRVSYVAITRAKKECVITLPSSHRYYDFPGEKNVRISKQSYLGGISRQRPGSEIFQGQTGL